MKQLSQKMLLMLVVLLSPLTMTAGPATLEENEEYLNIDEITTQSWKTDYTFSAETIAKLQVGDVITITVIDKGDNEWAQLNLDTKSETDERKNKYNVVVLVNNKLYNMNSFPVDLSYTVTATDLAAIREKSSLYISGTEGVKFKEIKWKHYVDPGSTTKTLDVSTTLYEGVTPLANWTQNYSQPASVINSLQEGDILSVTVSGTTDSNCQLRIAWGGENGQFVSWTGLQNETMPKDYAIVLTADQVANIKKANKLYLNGCNITVSTWKLIQHKTISKERGNATKTVWTGTTLIDWNNSSYQTLDAGLFGTATAGMKMRLNFLGMKMGAQGRIVKSDWSAFADADTYEKLPTAWGDYYEYTLTDDMATELQANGCIVSGVGYMLASVELIDPLREYVVNAVFDANDIKAWEVSEGTPNLTVTLTNYEEQEVTTTVCATLMTDMFEDFNSFEQEVTLSAGETKTVDLEFPALTPGFYRMTAKANNNTICTYVIGYDPTSIVSPNDAQPDFWQFWDTWKTRLAAIDMAAEMTLMEEASTGARNVYKVKLMSAPDTKGGAAVPIWGYYAEPKAEGTYPALIRFHGTDSGTGVLSVPGTDSNTDWCEFMFSARGQMLSRAENGNAYKVNGETDFYSYRLGDNDEHYYRAAYLDTRRALDFVYAQTKVNKDAIFAAGGSQGGCFTYVCAALSDGRIRAIAPHITGHADFVHTMEIVTWPTNKFNEWINAQVEAGNYANYEEGKAALLRHQSYFDTKNFASRITCPVITNFSLQDQTDGPHLNISPYNLLTHVAKEDKQYSINPFLGHAAKSGWEAEYMAFFQKYITEGKGQQHFFVNGGSEGWSTLCLDFKAKVPEDVTVYTVTEKSETEQSVVLKAHETGTVVPAHTAIIVKGTVYGDALFSASEDEDTDMGTNLLKGVTERTLISTLNNGNGILVLGKKGDAVGFYSTATTYLPAHRAYLEREDAAAGAQGYVFSYYNDETTGIVYAHPSTSETPQYYTLDGRKLSTMPTTKGIYVVNGKKIIIK